MPERIRFTLIENGEDVRPYDFDTETVQIGADPDRGDNLLIKLPTRLRHVRAKIFRTPDYVELEVKAGPIWLQGSKLEEGDVAELNIGDLLVFGTKKERGVRLRYEVAAEAEIVMDDVADWSVSAAPKKGRKTADDDLMFEEEANPTDGMNPYQKGIYHYRQQYKKFTAWRKKAARVKYWISAAKILWQKAGKIAMVVGGFAALGFGFMNERSQKVEALEVQAIAEDREEQAVLAERHAIEARQEIEGMMRECGCAGSQGADAGSMAAAEALGTYFGEDNDGFAPQREVAMPNQTMTSLAGIINGPLLSAKRSKTMLQNTIDRVCSAVKDKDRMQLVQQELGRYDIHEAYSFIPFVESLWCKLAVSFTGPRGMMQFTRATASEAFRRVDPTQADIPAYDFDAHYQWLAGKSGRYGGYYGMLAVCPATIRADYIRHFYEGQTNPQYPNRVDPRDPRTDWEWSIKAAFSFLEVLDGRYKGKGYRDIDAVMMAMSAYNQGEGMVNKWVKAAKERYGMDNEAALTYTHVYGGAMQAWQNETDAEQKRRIKEGMSYAPKIVAYYLHTAPMLDAKKCRE